MSFPDLDNITDLAPPFGIDATAFEGEISAIVTCTPLITAKIGGDVLIVATMMSTPLVTASINKISV